jgi:CheY-like chemotaxis protein
MLETQDIVDPKFVGNFSELEQLAMQSLKVPQPRSASYRQDGQKQPKVKYISFDLCIQEIYEGVPKNPENIFVNFDTLQKEEEQLKYTGKSLALSISKTIVEKMGGSVTLRSQANACMYSLNYKCMALNQTHLAKPRGTLNSLNPPKIPKDFLGYLQGHSPAAEEFKPRMLFVNDEGFIRMTHSFQFAQDFHFQEAENGLQALQIVASNPIDFFDLIILDINMPIMDGWEACLRIHKFCNRRGGKAENDFATVLTNNMKPVENL